MNNNLPYYLGFSHFEGIGPIKFNALESHFGSVKLAYQANKKDLEQVIGISLTNKFVNFRNKFDPEKKLKELKQKRITVITREDKKYPPQLKNIPDPPICLYVKDNIDQFDFNNDQFIAIVGTRKPTAYGVQITKKFSHELTQAGFVIVSGMAMGIDATAHQSCLDGGGRTIAFLGCGVDIIYPSINARLYYQIINNNGLVISEFPPGQFVVKGLFINRNRLISGLSKGVLVIEGAKDSGAMITARFAAEQGKDVFAPPVPITSEMSEAPSILLKQGAKLITLTEDILEEYNLKIIPKSKQKIINNLDNDEKIIADLLLKQAHTVDELLETTKLHINQLLNILSILEIKGLVEKNSEGAYQLINF